MHDADALAVLERHRAHLVICNKDKRAMWWRWPECPAPLEVALAHDAHLGIVPWSITRTGVDVDSGDWRQLPEAWASYETPRGHHLYYADGQRRGNRRWRAKGCAGDIRGGAGYLVLHGDAAQRLADALESSTRQLPLFDPELFLPPAPVPPASVHVLASIHVPASYARPTGASLEL